MKEEYSMLIVEDEAIASYYLKELLRSLDYHNIYEATNAKDALDIVKTTHIDFVFLDINISGPIDGIVCAQMINQQYFLPIIFTTAYCETQTMQEASRTNMFGYLMKPFEKQDIEAILYVAFNRLSTMQEVKNMKMRTRQRELIHINDEQYFLVNTKTLFTNDVPVELTKKEMEILYALSSNLNQNISYKTLQDDVWDKKAVSNSTIRDTIRRLRVKSPELDIQSIAGFGYILIGHE